MDNLRVLCTGNPDVLGLPNSIRNSFPDATFISLSKGYDFTTDEGFLKFRSIIKDYNVFINISNLPNSGQEKLLRIAHEEWDKGYVFNIGSIAEYKKWENYDKQYTADKRKLKETSLELCSNNFRTTHITVGGFRDYQDNSVERMDPEEIVKIIKYVLTSAINIPIVGIEKIVD